MSPFFYTILFAIISSKRAFTKYAKHFAGVENNASQKQMGYEMFIKLNFPKA